MTDLETTFMYVGMGLTALTVLAHGLELLGQLLVRLAFETTTERDDKIANGVLLAAQKLSGALSKLGSLLPALRRK